MTDELWEIVGRAAMRFNRKQPMLYIINDDQVAWAGKHAKSCGSCVNAKMHGDPRRGFCVEMRFLTSLAFPVLCKGYKSI